MPTVMMKKRQKSKRPKARPAEAGRPALHLIRKEKQMKETKETIRYYIATFNDGNRETRIPFCTNFPSTLPVIRIRELIKNLKLRNPELKTAILSGYAPSTEPAILKKFGTKKENLPKICHEKKGIQTRWWYDFPENAAERKENHDDH